jgi:Rrf2 family protein
LKFSKSTLYALYAALELAGAEQPVTVASVAERFGLPPGALAKVFQRLVRAGLAVGVRGIGGGYVLSKPAAEITVLDVISVFDAPRRDGHFLLAERSEAARAQPTDARLSRLFDEVAEVVSCTFASVTLETLARS